MSLQRYDIWIHPGCPGWEEAYTEADERPDGYWIKVDDLEDILKYIEENYDHITPDKVRFLFLGD